MWLPIGEEVNTVAPPQIYRDGISFGVAYDDLLEFLPVAFLNGYGYADAFYGRRRWFGGKGCNAFLVGGACGPHKRSLGRSRDWIVRPEAVWLGRNGRGAS